MGKIFFFLRGENRRAKSREKFSRAVFLVHVSCSMTYGLTLLTQNRKEQQYDWAERKWEGRQCMLEKVAEKKLHTANRPQTQLTRLEISRHYPLAQCINKTK